MTWQLLILSSGFLSLSVALILKRWLDKKNCDNPQMKEYSLAIQEGAKTYLRRLFKSLLSLAFFFSLVIFFFLGWRTAFAYLFGSFCSALAGYLGMKVATQANAKVAWAAKKGLKEAFPVGFFGGAVMGLSVIGLALL